MDEGHRRLHTDRLAEKSTEFAAQLIRRQPARAAARELYRLVAQMVETADVVDDHRDY
ncbi:hypothetical protein ACFY8P_26995 [Streptomyces sp. NPDC012693]|uniref:hypothetical protein n=1 Tax=Streptomyces sp. NPDC012693 TaxID=3364844 RepID=UPI00367A75A3